MSRFITEQDHSRLKDAMQRLNRVEAAISRIVNGGARPPEQADGVSFAVPDARIPAASVISAAVVAPSVGDATFYRYSTDTPSVRFDVVGASRGKLRLHNMHKGMWLWPGVIYQAVRDHHSGLWFAVLPASPTFKARPTGVISAGASGTVQVYINNSAVSGLTVSSVRHDWMVGTNPINSSHDCVCQWFDSEEAWTIVEAECP